MQTRHKLAFSQKDFRMCRTEHNDSARTRDIVRESAVHSMSQDVPIGLHEKQAFRYFIAIESGKIGGLIRFPILFCLPAPRL